MSAQVIDRSFRVLSSSTHVAARKAKVRKDNSNIISNMRFELIYQLCFAPEPTPEQVTREEFLLECD